MKFYIKQKVFSFKDKFKILDESQELQYEVKGKFMSLSNKLELVDKLGNPVLRAKRKVLAFLPKYFIYNLKGEEIATIKRIFGFRPRFTLSALRTDLEVEGSLFAHSFGIFDHGNEVATISKKIISWGDTYEINIIDEENTELFLFIVIVLDQIIHERKQAFA